MKKIILSLLCLITSLLAVAQVPVNDECSGALVVIPSPDANPGTSVVSDNTNATQSMSGCGTAVQNDVWFKFIATASRHKINVSTSISNTVMQVFTGTCGSLQPLTSGCWAGGASGTPNFLTVDLTDLVVGATYYYRTFSTTNAVTIFTTNITTLLAAVNDECSGAIAIPVNTDNNCTNIYNGNTSASSQSRPSCVSSGYDAKDVWLKFVATSTSHKITVIPFNNYNFVFEVFSGTCNSLTSLACVNTGAASEPDIAVVNNLVAGNTYYMRLYDYNGANSISQQFRICISTASKILDNDECSDALAVIPSPDDNPRTSVTSTNTGATQSMSGCSGGVQNDVWFKFTATATKQKITVISSNAISPALQVFSGTCGSLQSLGCWTAVPSPYNEIVQPVLTNLTPGATYYYRTYGSSSLKSIITTYITSPPYTIVKDDCSDAPAVIPSPDANPGTSVVSENTNATRSMTECFGAVQNDVWFKFTATATRHRVHIAANRGTSPMLQVFSGTCNALHSLGCWGVSANGNGFAVVDADLADLTPGTTYYYRVYTGSTPTSISTYIITLPTAAVNDECSGAITLSVDNGSSCTNAYTGFLEFATQSRPACVFTGNYQAKDVWFKFIATSASHRIAVAPLEFNNFVFEVFSGTCNGLTSLACVNPGSESEPDIAVLNNLVAGNTYYIRVYEASGRNQIAQQFSICVSTTNSILDNDECSGALAVIPYSNTTSTPDVISHNFGATQSMAGCFGSAEDDVWFKFTATSTKYRVAIISSKSINPVLEVFSGTCGSLQPLGCRYTNVGMSYYYVDADLANLTPGATYYYRTYGSSSSNMRTRITTNIYTLSAAPALPITMTAFTVKPDKGKNVLRWQTLSETNNSGFEIQYSRDGVYFDSLNFVGSHARSGNSSVNQSYLYEHDVTGMGAGKVYYRLKQTDYDLRYHYSPVVSAEMAGNQSVSILPNPVGDYIHLSMPQTKGCQFAVYDYVGKIYKQGALQNNDIKVPELNPGMYILRLTNDKGVVVVLKFLKM